MYWRFTPAVALPFFCCPVSSSAATRQLSGGGFQVFGHEPADDAHRRGGVPHRVVEQPLHPVRGGVPGVLGNRPAVLARQIAHQPDDVLAGLLPRLDPGEAVAQPSVELAQVLLGQRGLYHGRYGRLMIFLPHNMMIIGWPPSLHPPTGQDHEVRLPYRASVGSVGGSIGSPSSTRTDWTACRRTPETPCSSRSTGCCGAGAPSSGPACPAPHSST